MDSYKIKKIQHPRNRSKLDQPFKKLPPSTTSTAFEAVLPVIKPYKTTSNNISKPNKINKTNVNQYISTDKYITQMDTMAQHNEGDQTNKQNNNIQKDIQSSYNKVLYMDFF